MSLFLAFGYMGFLGAIYVGIVKFLQYRKSMEEEADVRKIAPALMHRAVANIHKMIKLREDKQAVSILLKYGSVGDDLWNELTTAEEVLSQEIMDTVESADMVKNGWGQSIFPEAQRIVQVQQQKAAEENQKRIQKMMQQMKQQQQLEQSALE